MSDFLHNLRTGNLKRMDRPRKNYDNPQHRNQHDRNYGKDRKGNYHKKAHTGDHLHEIKKQLEGMARTIENNLKAQEKTAAALERIAAVLEATTGIVPAPAAIRNDSAAQAVAPEVVPEPEQEPSAANRPEETLLATISALRKDGLSFEKIAAELEDRQIPTVSGRGQWRGQAVSKFLKGNA